ncbi:MAG: DNA recombination protein RmuC [Phycisphaerae bacterium]|nr:DNA recombination protein RmuC [Phycisphaerae bacterium]
MEFALGLIVGLLVGAALTWALVAMRARAVKADRAEMERQMREAFSSLAAAALDANSDRLGKQTAGLLDAKKQLIDQTLQNVNERLNKLGDYFNVVEKDRKSEFGRLSESVGSLATSAGELHKILASTQRRGAWGERMADDILRLAGLSEGVNYTKQSIAASDEDRQTRPDFTFSLPSERIVNMDVKFPLENYRAYLDADNDDARAEKRDQLVRDVKGHVRAVASRGYVDTKAGTVDYVLLFIPSEQIYSLVLEASPDLIDDALRQRVVLTSPLTLYAMLAVIRQAAQNANLMKTADEVLELLAAFYKQWQVYNEEVDRLGKQIDTVRNQYEKVATTRTHMLQRPLDKIEDLRRQRGMEEQQEP